MQKHLLRATIVGVALLLTSGAVWAADRDDGQRGQLSEKDFKFAKEAAQGGQMEVQLGQLAQQKGVDQSVKSFGERMVTDHKKANDELQKIIAQQGATLPATMSHSEQSTLDKLQKENGADFDKKYASAMVKDHKKDLKDFQDAAKDAQDPDLKAFAEKTAAIIQGHLTAAEDMERAVKNEK